MELGGRGQHLGLGAVPQLPGQRGQVLRRLHHLRPKALLRAEVAPHNLPVDELDGLVRRQRDVEDREVPLQAVGDVVAAGARVLHGSQELHGHDGGPLGPPLVQVVEPALLDQLPHQLVGLLVPPLVDLGHVHVVDEDDHPSAGRRPWARGTGWA